VGTLAHGDGQRLSGVSAVPHNNDGVSMDDPDASSMQSVRHTQACINMGEWSECMELRLSGRLLVGHFSPWASPHHVSASAHSPWANSGNGTTTRSGGLGSLCDVSLARSRPCTQSWPDFTYIRAD
jgi:hypothetical protein